MSEKNDSTVSRLRKSRGWTQERLCEHSGVPVRTIQRLEAGHEASLDTLSRIADALHVDVRDLFITTPDASFTAAIDGLDDRRAQIRRRRSIMNITGCSLTALGVLAGAGGGWSSPHPWPYVIGGLVTVCIGLWMIRHRPSWLPLTAVWVTVAMTVAYLLAYGWPWWEFTCAAVVVIAIGAVSTCVLHGTNSQSASGEKV